MVVGLLEAICCSSSENCIEFLTWELSPTKDFVAEGHP